MDVQAKSVVGVQHMLIVIQVDGYVAATQVMNARHIIKIHAQMVVIVQQLITISMKTVVTIKAENVITDTEPARMGYALLAHERPVLDKDTNAAH